MRYYNDDDDAPIILLWNEGKTTVEIARRLGRTKNAICGRVNRLAKMGKIAPRGTPLKQRKDGETHKKNSRPPSWITEERKEFLRIWWGSYVPRRTLLEYLASTPGVYWPSGNAVSVYATGMLQTKRPLDINKNTEAVRIADIAFRRKMEMPDRSEVRVTAPREDPIYVPKPRKESWALVPVTALRGAVGLHLALKMPLCTWPGCKTAPVGKWCADHTKLLQSPASEIAQRLPTWR